MTESVSLLLVFLMLMSGGAVTSANAMNQFNDCDTVGSLPAAPVMNDPSMEFFGDYVVPVISATKEFADTPLTVSEINAAIDYFDNGIDINQMAALSDLTPAEWLDRYRNYGIVSDNSYGFSNGYTFNIESFVVGNYYGPCEWLQGKTFYGYRWSTHDPQGNLVAYKQSPTVEKCNSILTSSAFTNNTGMYSIAPYQFSNFKWDGSYITFDYTCEWGYNYDRDGRQVSSYLITRSELGIPKNTTMSQQGIGSISIDGQDYVLNPSGAIDYGGSTIAMNPDGTYTLPNGDVVSGAKVKPSSFDDAALALMLLDLLNMIQDLEKDDDLTFDDSESDVITSDIEYVGDLSEFTYMSPSWGTVFPFCIPWDFVNGVKLLSSTPVAPRWEIPFEVPEFQGFPGYSKTIVLDLSEYDKYFVVVRWFTTIFFLISLGFISFKIVKGV